MKKRGVGISCVLHPTGNKGGGDPSQAAIELKPDGTFVLLIGAVDLGQGSTTILRQFAADALDVPIENIFASNFADDFAPLSLGSFASRVTLIDPHAVYNAADDLKQKIREYVAPMLQKNLQEIVSMQKVEPDQVVIADNKVFVDGYPEHAMSMAEVGGAANFGGGAEAKFLVGTGAWQPDFFHPHDSETGAMPAVGAVSFGSCIVEVEVDTETGEVELLKLTQVWEMGKAVNPLMVRQQINGGLNIGMGTSLIENTYPYYPSADFAPDNFSDYAMPTFADYPQELQYGYAEVPHPNGVQGAKGFSEGSSNAPPPAIMAAIHDAIGVWINEYPASPEVILRALEEKEAEG